MWPLIVSRWFPLQPIRVCVCETAPLKSAALFPLLCPHRLVRSKLWLKRRGPTYSPCYATLSGWRSLDEMLFTKSLFSKTSIRFLHHCQISLLNLNDPYNRSTFLFKFLYFSPSRLLASCPEWLYMQRSWTTILSGSMSIIRYASLIIYENKITAYGVGVVFLALWTAGFCYYRKAQHWDHELASKWPLLNVIFALKQ